MHKNKEEIRDLYLKNEILLVGTKLTEDREVIDRRANYVVIVNKDGQDSKLFLDEAYSSILPPKKKSYRSFVKTITETTEDFAYKGYVTKNFDSYNIRECFEKLVSTEVDQYALLHAIKAVDQLIESKDTETFNRAKKYITKIDDISNHPYLDALDDVLENTKKDPSDSMAVIKKFVKPLPKVVVQEKIGYTAFTGFVLSEDFQETAQKMLHHIAQNPKELDKMAGNVKDLEDIAHHYDDGDLHIHKSLMSEEKTEKKPLYVCRHLLNPKPFIEWAKLNGFDKVLSPKELHVTVAYSKKSMNWDTCTPDTNEIIVRGGKRSVTPLGDKGAVVLKFESDKLQKRFKEFKNAGASWDYENYQPHISITYKNGIEDLSKIKPYEGELVFGPEEFMPIDDNYADNVIEEHISLNLEKFKEMPAIERTQHLGLKKLSSDATVFKIAKRTSVSLLANKLASKPMAKVSKKEKDFVETLIKKNAKVVLNLAKRLIPKIMEIEINRVHPEEKSE